LRALETAGGRALDPIRCAFVGESLVNLVSGEALEIADAAHRLTVAVCGVAKPEQFRSMVQDLGIPVVDWLVFPDHHPYSRADVAAIKDRVDRCRAEMAITTEKDAGKLAPLLDRDARFWALRLGVEIIEGHDRLEQMLDAVTSKG
jgi:tetraacyldisaccharide 4'-kinase